MPTSSNPERPTDDTNKLRGKAISFYLPQFHPIAENDRWWQPGFTDWNNVVVTKPRYKGHYQPHLPGALGFYDLRLEQTRIDQAAMAEQHGIHGFCYYHYWFAGKRLLEQPFDEVRRSGVPDFPFCLCWANQTWSRTWSGRGQDVLVAQEYSDADNDAHIEWLIEAFGDPRYIRVDGKPLFLIYLPEGIPDLSALLDRWKTRVHERLGLEPHFCAVRTGFSTISNEGLIAHGFDAIVDFQPNRNTFPKAINATGKGISLLRRLLPESWYDAMRDSLLLGSRDINTRVDYRALAEAALQQVSDSQCITYPSVFPSWDNSARRTAATIIQNNSADDYLRWLIGALDRVSSYPEENRLVFLNAWNEWAEGCHLEPDQQNEFVFLEATRKALMSQN